MKNLWCAIALISFSLYSVPHRLQERLKDVSSHITCGDYVSLRKAAHTLNEMYRKNPNARLGTEALLLRVALGMQNQIVALDRDKARILLYSIVHGTRAADGIHRLTALEYLKKINESQG